MFRRTKLEERALFGVNATNQHSPRPTADVTVVIPTFCRPAMLEACLTRLLQCSPAPTRILVFVDAGDKKTPEMLARKFAGLVEWVESCATMGPGGGRNVLIRMAETPWVVSFDDDSWPEDNDFFARLNKHCSQPTRAGALAFPINVRGVRPADWPAQPSAASCFENCGCAIRVEAFLETSGFLPLRYAYDMEEKDVTLQLIDRGWQVLAIPDLVVFHDTNLAHRDHPQVTAAHITNRALLCFLRYPIYYWPLGLLQTLNRVRYSLGAGNWRGIISGVARIPYACWKHRKSRRLVSRQSVQAVRTLNVSLTPIAS